MAHNTLFSNHISYFTYYYMGAHQIVINRHFIRVILFIWYYGDFKEFYTINIFNTFTVKKTFLSVFLYSKKILCFFLVGKTILKYSFFTKLYALLCNSVFPKSKIKYLQTILILLFFLMFRIKVYFSHFIFKVKWRMYDFTLIYFVFFLNPYTYMISDKKFTWMMSGIELYVVGVFRISIFEIYFNLNFTWEKSTKYLIFYKTTVFCKISLVFKLKFKEKKITGT